MTWKVNQCAACWCASEQNVLFYSEKKPKADRKNKEKECRLKERMQEKQVEDQKMIERIRNREREA